MPNHSTALAHQFDDIEQQHDSASLGMWIFLSTEIMFFGGMFLGYALYRGKYAPAYAQASRHLDVRLGGINTGVLLCSSLTMALAVHAAQLGGRGFDPQVHRVHTDDTLALHLVQDALLQQRVHVAQEDDVGLLVGRGQVRLEAFEDVELGEQRLAAVQVQAVLAAPAERLAFGVGDTLQVDAPTFEELQLLVAEVFADDGDQVDIGEERSGQGEVGERATHDVGDLAERRLDGVERDGADGQNGHRYL